jgi:hypothetical protein
LLRVLLEVLFMMGKVSCLLGGFVEG